jgi:hypothetical protein
MDERWTYDAIRWSAFQDMYRVRRNISQDKRGWGHPLEDVGVAFDYDDDPPPLPDLHWLMLESCYLILGTGLTPEPGKVRATQRIQSILAHTPLDQLLADVPEDEARELRIDLEILGFIAPDITKPQWG